MARQGKPPTKNCPAWLDVAGAGKDRHYIEIEDRVEIVKRIFAMAAAGMGEMAMIKKLNANGDLNFRKPPTGWQAGQINHIVTSKAPIGIMVSNKGGDEGTKEFEHYPPIIDETAWRAAQQARKANRATKQNWAEAERNGTHPPVRNLFPSLLHCCYCGGKMQFNTYPARKDTPPRFRLYCIAAMNKSGCAAKAGISYLPLERAILSRLEYADREGLLNENTDEDTRIADLKINRIKNLIDTATAQYGNLSDAYERNPSQLKEERMNKKEAEINAMRAELREAKSNRPALTTDDHKRALTELREAAERGDYESRLRVRFALKDLVGRIACDVISGCSVVYTVRKAYRFLCDPCGNTYDFAPLVERWGEDAIAEIFDDEAAMRAVVEKMDRMKELEGEIPSPTRHKRLRLPPRRQVALEEEG